MGIVEKYCRATQSSNLKDDAQHHSTEALAAVALSDLGFNGIGNLLFRVKYANDATSYRRLAERWETIVLAKSQHRKWPSHVPPKKVAELALAHFLNDVCPGCSGKGHLPLDAAPILSDDPCPVCAGRGTVDVDCERRLEDYVKDMVESLNEMVRHAGALALRKLAGVLEE
jgi:hypothetical protein